MAGASTNTALAAAFYRTLLWQLALIVVIAVAVVLIVRRRPVLAEPTTPEPLGRRIVRIGLGVLWIIDGLLQAQPAMPSSFVPKIISPGLAAAPSWLFSVVDPFARFWVQHPVGAAALTVWLQLGIGVALLVGGRSVWSRIAIYVSISWALVVWVLGAFVGGLLVSGASFLTGAPGAALMYAAASVLLLLPWSMWSSGRAQLWSRRIVGAVFVGGAALAALPSGGFWSGQTYGVLFAGAADMGMPAVVAKPVTAFANFVGPHPGAFNVAVIVVLATIGLALILDVWTKPFVIAAAVVCLFAWWFGQGFGVFGGVGTDPNTAVPLLVLLAASWPWARQRKEAPDNVVADPDAVEISPRRSVGTLVGVGLALGALLVMPVAAVAAIFAAPTAQGAIGDSGGLIVTSPAPLPDFTLTDQNLQSISLHSLRGNLVLVAFLDPECFDACPIMANQLSSAVASLGSRGRHVQLLAIDINPYFNHVSDVRAFTNAHGLAHLANWHFVTGSNAAVGQVLTDFGQGVSLTRVGMIGHPQTVVLVNQNGEQLATVNDTANEDLTKSYAALLAAGLRQYL